MLGEEGAPRDVCREGACRRRRLPVFAFRGVWTGRTSNYCGWFKLSLVLGLHLSPPVGVGHFSINRSGVTQFELVKDCRPPITHTHNALSSNTTHPHSFGFHAAFIRRFGHIPETDKMPRYSSLRPFFSFQFLSSS